MTRIIPPNKKPGSAEVTGFVIAASIVANVVSPKPTVLNKNPMNGIKEANIQIIAPITIIKKLGADITCSIIAIGLSLIFLTSNITDRVVDIIYCGMSHTICFQSVQHFLGLYLQTSSV